MLRALHGAEFRLNLIAFANIKAKFIATRPTEILIYRACVTLENKGVAVFLGVLRAVLAPGRKARKRRFASQA